LIPVKWYISIMLFAGAVTFVYGIATADMHTILGSFLFTGIGGIAYLLYRKPRIGAISVPKTNQKVNEFVAPVQLALAPLHVSTEQTHLAGPPEAGPKPQEIIKMICAGCGKESADEFTFCPYCGKQKIVETVCRACGKESAGGFNFCPHCGEAFLINPNPARQGEKKCPNCAEFVQPDARICRFCQTRFVESEAAIRVQSADTSKREVIQRLQVQGYRGNELVDRAREQLKIESSNPSPEVQPVEDTTTDESEPIRDGVAHTSIRVGTLVFGAFSAISLLVSIIKGLVPIYLLESAGWAGVAWYWQRKKAHSELAKAIVIVLAVLVAIGEVVHIAFQPDSKSTAPTASDPFAAYGGHEVAPVEASVPSHLADIEKQAVSLFNQKQYKEARPLFEQACNGTDENGFKYAGFDGEMKACNYLGYLYAQGLGGPHETKKARDAYQKACDQGILPSCASLGSLYQDAGDSVNARYYFQKACDCKVTEACELLRGVQ